MIKLKSSIGLTAIFLLFFSFTCVAQQRTFHALGIGDSVGNLPPFKNIINYPAPKLSLSDLKGKLIIIDFWSTGCPSCIASMPRLEKLQKRFNGQIQIILVNPWESKDKIEQRVAKMKILRTGIGLTSLPNVYGDTVWRVIFPHSSLPHHVWIDKYGKVIATTSGINATEEHINQVLNSGKLKVSLKNDLKARGYDVRKSGLMKAGDTSLIPSAYSAILKANHGFGGGQQVIIDSLNGLYKMVIYNESVLSLYQIAYRGYYVSLEVKDRSNYLRPNDANKMDSWFDKNCFSYEIAVPIIEKDSVFHYMRSDLNRFFSAQRSVRAGLGKRQYPTYVLKETNHQLLMEASLKNIAALKAHENLKGNVIKSFQSAQKYIEENLKDLSKSVPKTFIDETGIKDGEKVFVMLPENLDGKENLQRILEQQGLGLILENRKMEVAIINESGQL